MLFLVQRMIAYREKMVKNPNLLKPAATAYFWKQHQTISRKTSTLVAQVAEFNGKLPSLIGETPKGPNKINALKAKVNVTEAKKWNKIKADFGTITTNFLKIMDLLFSKSDVELSIESRANSAAVPVRAVALANARVHRHPGDSTSVKVVVVFAVGLSIVITVLVYLFFLRVSYWSVNF